MKIIVTGGAGFIGSCFIQKLNACGVSDITVIDELGDGDKWRNLRGKAIDDYIEKKSFIELIRSDEISPSFDCICHFGACSSTTETNATYLIENNYRYTKDLAEWSLRHNIRFLYASSAATYGDGANGYCDGDTVTLRLCPLNMYGFSKQLFDLWVLRNNLQKRFVGFKFFNVFGPNEYHKGDMRSKICKGYHEIKDTGAIQLFKSYKPQYAHGEQKRDFVYVRDVVDILWFFICNRKCTGIYNIGMGRAHSWNELARALFKAMKRKENITYIEMPDHLRDTYQYFTEADVKKLREAGYQGTFTDLETAVKDYVDIMEGSRFI